MGNRPTKKVVLFLVEGDSERKALQGRIEEYYDSIDESIQVFFPEMFLPNRIPDDPTAKVEVGGDITQLYDVYPGNYDEKVYEYFLREFFDIEKLLPKDITEVIQIVDMDGAYIDDSKIMEYDNPSIERKPYYGDDTITCCRPNVIKNRHRRKRLNLDYLKTKDSIKIKSKTKPFSVYYFSSNLDHFLHNTANLESELKTSLAETFSDGFDGNPEGFANVFLKDKDSALSQTYSESWDFITNQGTADSLKRHTNFNLLIEKLIK